MNVKQKNKLNYRQERFCDEFITDLHGTNAAVRAGYSKNGAEVTASQLLRNPKIKRRINILKQKRSDKTDITAERVLKEIAKMAFSNLEDYIKVQKDGTAIIDLSKLTRNQAAALSEVAVDDTADGKRVKIKLHDKLKGLEQLGRHLKLFTDKVDIEGELTFKGIEVTFIGKDKKPAS